MATTNLGQSILNSLVSQNAQLKKVEDVLAKLEDNEIEAFKNNYDFKNTIVNEMKSSIQSLSNIMMSMNSKIESKNTEANKDLEDLKRGIDNINTKLITVSGKDCDNCKALQQGDKTMARLWYIIAFLFLTLIAVLGLNLFGVISLPGLP